MWRLSKSTKDESFTVTLEYNGKEKSLPVSQQTVFRLVQVLEIIDEMKENTQTDLNNVKEALKASNGH